MAYVLQVGSLQNVKLPYTYARRAQSTLHQVVWKQIMMCEDKQPLIDWAKANPPSTFSPGAKYRIEGVGNRALEGITEL